MAEAFLAAFLALCFALSSAYKVRDLDGFREASEDFSLLRRLPTPVRSLTVYLVPAAEAAVGVLLIVPATNTLGAVAACGLGMAFTLVVALDPRSAIAHCGCWGVASAEIPKTYYLARAGSLLTAAVAALVVGLTTGTLTWSLGLAVVAFGLTAPVALLLLELPQIGQIIYIQALSLSTGEVTG